MIKSAMRCPACGELMTYEPELQFIDCPVGHRASSDPDGWHTHKVYVLVAEIEAVLKPDWSHECDHHWITIEQTRHESLNECASCSAWQIGPGLATTPHHGG